MSKYSLTMTTRDCLVEEAARLFASRGFAGTPVAEVQRACGLAPGSGALYKHFTSKEELFTAVIERALEENREYVARGEVLLSEDLDETLRNMARGGLDALTRQQDVFRVLFRDADRFPALRDRFRDEGAQPVYAAFAMWLQAGIEDGRSLPETSGKRCELAWAFVDQRRIELLTSPVRGVRSTN